MGAKKFLLIITERSSMKPPPLESQRGHDDGKSHLNSHINGQC